MQIQTWGVPWRPEQFVCQAVKAGHPMVLRACLPSLLKELVQKHHSTSTLVRVQHRIRRVKHWMARAKQLEEADRNLVRSMRPDVASALRGKRMRLWEDVLKSIGSEDMGVVKEFTEGSHLVWRCDVIGLRPKKFPPATMRIDELHCTAARERELQSQWHVGVGDSDAQKSVWHQTLKEVETGALWTKLTLLSPLVEGSGCSKGRRFVVLTTSLAPE